MKFWILKAIEGTPAFEPWYDKTFGLVVRAESEPAARRLASGDASGDDPGDEGPGVWLDPLQTTCVRLFEEGDPDVILVDFRAA